MTTRSDLPPPTRLLATPHPPPHVLVKGWTWMMALFEPAFSFFLFFLRCTPVFSVRAFRHRAVRSSPTLKRFFFLSSFLRCCVLLHQRVGEMVPKNWACTLTNGFFLSRHPSGPLGWGIVLIQENLSGPQGEIFLSFFLAESRTPIFWLDFSHVVSRLEPGPYVKP